MMLCGMPKIVRAQESPGNSHPFHTHSALCKPSKDSALGSVLVQRSFMKQSDSGHANLGRSISLSRSCVVCVVYG